jgi:hypothetical protein
MKTMALDDRPDLINPDGSRTVAWLTLLREQDQIGEEAMEWAGQKDRLARYQEFLKSKAVVAQDRGYAGALHFTADLKPHAADIARWMIQGGNRACFASFGLHKTSIQLQVCESLLDSGCNSALIVCPLGVRREFIKEHAARGFKRLPVYVTTNDQYEELRAEGHELFLTNYERVRDGALDPNRFDICSLDEAAILRSFGSKTYQTFLPLFN